MAAKDIEKHKFAKGESGNPNGRPRKLPELDKLLADVLGEEKDGMTAAEAILKALRLKAAKGDVRAIEVMLDRAYGKPKQTISADVTQSITILNIDPLDDSIDNGTT
jgi:hypothetical protein